MTYRHTLCLNDHVGDLSEQQVARLIDTLPQWRREAALRYKFLQGRAECAVAYIELLRGLRLQFGITDMPEFETGPHGKPRLTAYPQVHFSISHCHAAVGCLVADRPCGLDIECVRPVKESLVRYTMSPEESDRILSSATPALAFTRIWTQKEAVLKLRGTGLVDNLHDVLRPDALQDIELETIENPIRNYVITKAILK